MTRCPGILACPVCGDLLTDDDRSLRCPRRHTFDRAREGYVNLLPAGHGRSRLRGDTRDMVAARRRFLERGHYEPLSAAIIRDGAVHLAGAEREARPAVAVEVGCGEGYHIGRLARAVGTGCYYGLDVSRDAVRLAARAYPEVCFLVNDVKRRLSVADASTDLLLNVFAPRSASEFGRALRPGGLVLVAIPGEAHLVELRAMLGLIGIEEDKPERTLERLGAAFDLAGEETLEYDREMPARDVLDLLRMTPHHWHLDDAALDRVAALDPLRVTINMLLLRLRRSGST